MESSLSKNANSFSHIVLRTLRGLVFGFTGGALAGALGGVIYWAPTKYFYHSLYANLAISEIIWADVLLIGTPIGLIIGISTGLHAGIFRNHAPKLLLWISLTAISTVLAVRLSGFNASNPVGLLLEVAFISLATSWLTYRFAMQEYQGDTPKHLATVMCSISGSLLTFLAVYGYFRFWIYLQNIPS